MYIYIYTELLIESESQNGGANNNLCFFFGCSENGPEPLRELREGPFHFRGRAMLVAPWSLRFCDAILGVELTESPTTFPELPRSRVEPEASLMRYIYICIYMYVYICIYIYICIQNC